MSNYDNQYVPLIPHASENTYGLVSYSDIKNLVPNNVTPHSHSTMTVPISPLWHTNNMDTYSGRIYLFPDMVENIHSAWAEKRWYTSNNFNIVLNSNASFVLRRYPHNAYGSNNYQSGMNPQNTMFTRFISPTGHNTQIDVTITFFQDDVAGWTPTLNLNQGDISSGWYPLTSNTSSSPYNLTGSSTPYTSRTIVLRWSGVWAQWQVIFDSGGWRPVPMYMAASSTLGGKYCRVTLDPAAVAANPPSVINNWVNTVYALGGLNVRKYMYTRGYNIQLNAGNGDDWFGSILVDGYPESAGPQQSPFGAYVKKFDGGGGSTTINSTPSAAYNDLVVTGVIDALYHEAGHWIEQTYLRNNNINANIHQDAIISDCHRTAILTSNAQFPEYNIFNDSQGHFYSQTEWLAQAIGTWILQKGFDDGSCTAYTEATFPYVILPKNLFGTTANKTAFYARMDALCPDLV